MWWWSYSRGSWNKKSRARHLMSPPPSTNFKIQKYYEDESRFDGAYARNNLPKIKYGAYVINPKEDESTGIHWRARGVSTWNGVTYLDSFVVEHIPKEIRKFIGNINIATKFFKIRAYDSIICGYFCLGFIDFMLKGIPIIA